MDNRITINDGESSVWELIEQHYINYEIDEHVIARFHTKQDAVEAAIYLAKKEYSQNFSWNIEPGIETYNSAEDFIKEKRKRFFLENSTTKNLRIHQDIS